MPLDFFDSEIEHVIEPFVEKIAQEGKEHTEHEHHQQGPELFRFEDVDEDEETEPYCKNDEACKKWISCKAG